MFLTLVNSTWAQTIHRQGSISASNNVELKVVTLLPDSFPKVSVVFEALKDNVPIFGLDKSHFTVHEDSLPCDVIRVQEISNDVPIHIALVIDHSGSMMGDYMDLYDMNTGQLKAGVVIDPGTGVVTSYPDGLTSPMENAKRAVNSFIDQFESDNDSISIIGFASEVDIHTDFSTDHEYLKSNVDSMHPTTSTALLTAMNEAVLSMKDIEGIRLVVALTDGLDNSSNISGNQLIKNATDLDIPLYCIGLGNADTTLLEFVSNGSNGSFYYTDDDESLTEIYGLIQKRIKSIYELRYTSNNLSSVDSIRNIKIHFERALDYSSADLSFALPDEVVNYLATREEKIRLQFIADQKRNNVIKYGSASLLITVLLGSVYIVRVRRRKKSPVKNVWKTFKGKK